MLKVNNLKELMGLGRLMGNGVVILEPDLHIHVTGMIHADYSIKTSGHTTITGDGLSSGLFFNSRAAGVCCTSTADTLSFSNMRLGALSSTPLFRIAKNTTRNLKLHKVVVDALHLGEIDVDALTFSRTEFVNELQNPASLASVDTLTLVGCNVVGKLPLFDMSHDRRIRLGATVIDTVFRNKESGLIIAADATDENHARHRLTCPNAAFVLENAIGLATPEDIFKVRIADGSLTTMNRTIANKWLA